MLATLIVAVTEPPDQFAGSPWMVPDQSVKVPLTRLMKCRIRKLTSEWATSMDQVGSAADAAGAA